MFNLLMSGRGWEPNHDSFDRSRTFEYTPDHITQQLKPNGLLDTEAITNIPALFASETAWDNSQEAARVGRLTRVRLVGGVYQLDYILDSDIPPIPNSELTRLSNALGIQPFEFSRTHWAVKEADLFEVLLKAGLGARKAPTVFKFSDDPVEENLVAVMMPFDPRFAPVYDALRAASAQENMICQRADDIWEHDHIIQDVVTLISRANIVICDLTGRNPNVFYEMGIAHSLGKNVIMITQSANDVPFDVAHIRHIKYLLNGEGLDTLRTDVARRLAGLQDRR